MSAATIYVPGSEEAYDAALEGLTLLNTVILSGGAYPPLYESGVRYKRELREQWKHAGLVARAGFGDCEDLACWLAAEMRLSGEYPDARVVTYRTGPNRFHAVVDCGGRIEDPSVVLGMQPVNPAAKIIDDPTPDDPEMSYEVSPDGSKALLRIPMHHGRAMVVSGDAGDVGDDVMGAWYSPLERVYKTAAAILATPEAQAILPPQARVALQAIKRSENVARVAREAWNKSAPARPRPEQQTRPSSPPAAPIFVEPEEEYFDEPVYDDDDPGMEGDVGAPFGFGAFRQRQQQQQQQSAPTSSSRTPGPVPPRGPAQQQAMPPDPYGYGQQQPPPGYGPPGYPPPGYGPPYPPQQFGQSWNPSAMPPPSPYGYGYPPPSPQDMMPQFDAYSLPNMYGGMPSDMVDPLAPPGGWNDQDLAMMSTQW